MNGIDFMNGTSLYFEISQSSLRVLKEDAGLELPLERLPNGRLTEPCKKRVTESVSGFLKRSAWQPKLRALCAIGARGVSLRQVSLPIASGDELRRLLLLQIESEFPLSPDELAWGYRLLSGKEKPRDEAVGRQTLMVVAVKKEALAEYTELLAACGVAPVFTMGALARSYLCSPLQDSYRMLEVGRSESELTTFENGTAVSVRVLPWGGDNLLQAASANQATDSLIIVMRADAIGSKVYLTGEGVRDRAVAGQLAENLRGRADCERIETGVGDGRSPTVLGLKQAVEKDNGASLVALQSAEIKTGGRKMQPAVTKWVVRAAALLLLVLVFPYVEALVMKPRLERKLTALKNASGRLVVIDRELGFLPSLNSNQPPYLDAVYLMANVAAQGTRIESVSMNRRGEVALRGTMQNSQQVADFRSKLISSGFYSNVVVEEQTPSQDRQKLTVRMTAQWKPVAFREGLALGPPPEDFEKLRTAAKDAKFAQAPPMMGNSFPMPGPSGPPPLMSAPPSTSPGQMTRPPVIRRMNLPPGVTIPGFPSGAEEKK